MMNLRVRMGLRGFYLHGLWHGSLVIFHPGTQQLGCFTSLVRQPDELGQLIAFMTGLRGLRSLFFFGLDTHPDNLLYSADTVAGVSLSRRQASAPPEPVLQQAGPGPGTWNLSAQEAQTGAKWPSGEVSDRWT